MLTATLILTLQP